MIISLFLVLRRFDKFSPRARIFAAAEEGLAAPLPVHVACIWRGAIGVPFAPVAVGCCCGGWLGSVAPPPPALSSVGPVAAPEAPASSISSASAVVGGAL